MPITEEAKAFVNDALAANKLVLFIKSQCPFCKKAREIFLKYLPEDQVYLAVIDGREDIINVQDVLGELTGARSVPRVFLNGKFIGGCSDIENLDSQGQLAVQLKQAGLPVKA